MENTTPVEFFVSPHGDDRWSGKLPDAKKSRKDGPFATVQRAQKAVRGLKVRGVLPQPVRVVLRGGVHELAEPWHLTEEDSGSPAPIDEWNRIVGPERSVTYAAFPGEEPMISGGRRITGWVETTLNGQRAWVAHLAQVAAGEWYFTQLWVNGRRAARTRLPREGYFRIEELLGKVGWEGSIHQQFFTGQDRFRFAEGDLLAWKNIRDIEFVALHYWIESRIPFHSVNVRSRTARLQWKSRMRLTDDHSQRGAPYYIENIWEELKESGQWYLDRDSGELFYLPLSHEKIENSEVYAPYLPQLMLLQGGGEPKQEVAHVHFEGLTFSHNEWDPGEVERNAPPQAACHVPGALRLSHARNCSLRHCTVTHAGSYGVELMDGTYDVEISRCTLTDLAGGGIKIWHGRADGKELEKATPYTCRRNLVSDCVISDGGHRWRQAVGVLVGRCSGNRVIHNHIHDFDYTAISVGWFWGYGEGNAYGNIAEHNYIHDIGRGVLSDMGAIYTLGVSPGTRIRHNVIHDVTSRGYGGLGIYLDEGSSNILVENNIVYRTNSSSFHQHYGRDNVIRNNIFAFGGEGMLLRTRCEPHQSYEFKHNIIFGGEETKMIIGDWNEVNADFDFNLYWSQAPRKMSFGGQKWKVWRERDADSHSIIADPNFLCTEEGKFELADNSPALRIGFVPFVVEAGPRPLKTKRAKSTP